MRGMRGGGGHRKSGYGNGSSLRVSPVLCQESATSLVTPQVGWRGLPLPGSTSPPMFYSPRQPGGLGAARGAVHEVLAPARSRCA